MFTQLYLEEYFIHTRVCSLDSAPNQIQIISSEKLVEELASKPKLRTYVTYKTEFGLQSYISSNMNRHRRSLMAQFRLSILPITVETGRFRNIPLQDRKYTICDLNEVENEKHFLCICPVYNDIKSTLYTKANTINSEFSTLNMSERFISWWNMYGGTCPFLFLLLGISESLYFTNNTGLEIILWLIREDIVLVMCELCLGCNSMYT